MFLFIFFLDLIVGPLNSLSPNIKNLKELAEYFFIISLR